MRHPSTLDANEILLKDRAGDIVGRLGQDKFGNTCLTLKAKANIARASLCVQDNEGSSLDLQNLKSESQALLTPGFYTVEPFARFKPALVINGKNYAAEDK